MVDMQADSNRNRELVYLNEEKYCERTAVSKPRVTGS